MPSNQFHVLAVGALLALTACIVGDQRDSSVSASAEVDQRRGVDYAWARPTSPQALRNAGYTFAVRYLSYDTTGKNLTAAEANGLFGAGIDVVANWEWGASDALGGYNKGVQQAQHAAMLASQLGVPADRPIYFSVDFDASSGQQASIDAYFDGVASVLGRDRVGAYAGYYVIQRLFDHGKIRWGWQTYAWSGGHWDSRAQLRQIQNGVTIAGAECDIDQAMVGDFGQWGPNPRPSAQSNEGSQAFLSPNQQHFMTTSGGIRHAFWDAAAHSVLHDTWGSAVTGRPVTFTYGAEQHVFARGTSGGLEHYFYKPSVGLNHDTWGTGLAGDPTAIVIGAFQGVWAVDGAGNLQHWWWSPNHAVEHDTWGAGVSGRPTVMLYNDQQHVFARGTTGALEHLWWTPNIGIQRDKWATSIASDPTAVRVGDFQDVWAVDGAGALQHWWWGPNTNGVQHDQWGTGVVGRPSIFLAGAQQHAFVRGTNGTLEHYWWDPASGVLHDTWGQGIASDPTAAPIGNQQHVWAQDASGVVQHWYWDPATNVVAHDSWGQ